MQSLSARLTVVVVPTVALAIDHCRNVRERLATLEPHYSASQDDPDTVLDAVVSGRTRLLFTSPEACVSGRKTERPPLALAAG